MHLTSQQQSHTKLQLHRFSLLDLCLTLQKPLSQVRSSLFIQCYKVNQFFTYFEWKRVLAVNIKYVILFCNKHTNNSIKTHIKCVELFVLLATFPLNLKCICVVPICGTVWLPDGAMRQFYLFNCVKKQGVPWDCFLSYRFSHSLQTSYETTLRYHVPYIKRVVQSKQFACIISIQHYTLTK